MTFHFSRLLRFVPHLPFTAVTWLYYRLFDYAGCTVCLITAAFYRCDVLHTFPTCLVSHCVRFGFLVHGLLPHAVTVYLRCCTARCLRSLPAAFVCSDSPSYWLRFYRTARSRYGRPLAVTHGSFRLLRTFTVVHTPTRMRDCLALLPACNVAAAPFVHLLPPRLPIRLLLSHLYGLPYLAFWLLVDFPLPRYRFVHCVALFCIAVRTRSRTFFAR